MEDALINKLNLSAKFNALYQHSLRSGCTKTVSEIYDKITRKRMSAGAPEKPTEIQDHRIAISEELHRNNKKDDQISSPLPSLKEDVVITTPLDSSDVEDILSSPIQQPLQIGSERFTAKYPAALKHDISIEDPLNYNAGSSDVEEICSSPVKYPLQTLSDVQLLSVDSDTETSEGRREINDFVQAEPNGKTQEGTKQIKLKRKMKSPDQSKPKKHRSKKTRQIAGTDQKTKISSSGRTVGLQCTKKSSNSHKKENRDTTMNGIDTMKKRNHLHSYWNIMPLSEALGRVHAPHSMSVMSLFGKDGIIETTRHNWRTIVDES